MYSRESKNLRETAKTEQPALRRSLICFRWAHMQSSRNCCAPAHHPSSEHYIQLNFNGSNPDGSFTLDESNTFLSPQGNPPNTIYG